MKIGVFVGFWAMSFCIFGQDVSQDTLKNKKPDTTTIQKKPPLPFKGGFFIEGSLESIPSLGKRNFGRQIGVGFNYRVLTVGVYQYRALGSITRDVIFPNVFELQYGYGGVYVGAKLVKSGPLFSTIRLHYGYGDFVWRRYDSGEDFLRDKFNLFKPELMIGLQPTRFFNIHLTGGYRYITDVELTSIDDKSFSGFTYSLGIQIGLFNE